MGLGFTIDSPLRVAHLGIDSVVSIVDDLLLEKVRRHYSRLHNLDFQSIGRTADDGRARRITAYLDMMHHLVSRKMEEIRQQPFFSDSIKDRYFQLLPSGSSLLKRYKELYFMADSPERETRSAALTKAMVPGEIQVNIMAKVDVLRKGEDGVPLPATYSDAGSALRGFASSRVNGSIVLSAGFNPRLYSYLSDFEDFYRKDGNPPRKRIILKVSDFRSALIQGKFLAKKGLEVSEFRIESGINCGGHAFASDGVLLPAVLEEFKAGKQELRDTLLPLIQRYYEDQGMAFPDAVDPDFMPAVTVQGGIGNGAEQRRLLEHYGADRTGWGSPFLMVPEATCVDEETTAQLCDAGEEDLYLSNVSPLGVPFNNLRGSGSEQDKLAKIETGKPGSKCPKGFLAFNTEFTENPICTASSQYQLLKISKLREDISDPGELQSHIDEVLDKDCLCVNLGYSALIRLGIVPAKTGKQAICPGPNAAWFRRAHTMEEMTDLIYSKSAELADPARPHMFAKELTMYVDYLERMMNFAPDDPKLMRQLTKMRSNLESGLESCERLLNQPALPGENFSSLRNAVVSQRERILQIFENATAAA